METTTIIELLLDLVFVRKETDLTQWILYVGLPSVQCRVLVCLPGAWWLPPRRRYTASARHKRNVSSCSRQGLLV